MSASASASTPARAANGGADVEAQNAGDPKGGSRSCLLSCCRSLSFAAACAALLCLAAHVMAMLVTRSAGTMDSHIVNQALRLYGCSTSVLCILLECELDWIISWFKAADNWVGRGILQTFLGLFTLELARSDGTTDFDRSLSIYRQVASYSMIAVGLVYGGGGMLCLGLVKRAQSRKAKERMKWESDLQQLDKQRDMLRAKLRNA